MSPSDSTPSPLPDREALVAEALALYESMTAPILDDHQRITRAMLVELECLRALNAARDARAAVEREIQERRVRAIIDAPIDAAPPELTPATYVHGVSPRVWAELVTLMGEEEATVFVADPESKEMARRLERRLLLERELLV